MSLPPLLARLIGVGKYYEYPHLQAEGDINAENLGKFLKEEFTISNPNYNFLRTLRLCISVAAFGKYGHGPRRKIYKGE